MDHAHSMDLRDMLDLVGVRLGELQINDGRKQSSEYAVRNFSKKLYFRPGWDESKGVQQVTAFAPKGLFLRSGQSFC